MKLFRGTSIRAKLINVIMMTVTPSLVLFASISFFRDVNTVETETKRELTTLAQVIGWNSASALLFWDQEAAIEVLSTLRLQPQIYQACLYDLEGRLFAHYVRANQFRPVTLPDDYPITEPRHEFRENHLNLFQPIVLDGEIVGTIFIQSSLDLLKSRTHSNLLIGLVVLLLSFALALVLSSQLERIVSRPLIKLTELAHKIREGSDFSVRAEKECDDEVGVLTDAFNQMLEQVEKNKGELQRANEELERRVQERTRQLEDQFAELERTEEQLRQSQKMEAVGKLAGGIAHDFNNLLTVIKSSSEFLKEGIDKSDPLYQDAEHIQVAADRAASLTRQLLAFSRKQVLRLDVFDLNQQLKPVERMLQRIIGEDIQLRTELAPQPLRIRFDPSQLEQIIFNLAVNAREAMPQGGTFTLKTERVVYEGKECVQLTVADTGVGMTEDVKNRVFEPFFTTREMGTGLGLSTVYGIVKQSESEIFVDSVPGKGTSFTLVFTEAQETFTGSSVETERAVAAGTYHSSDGILLIEDDQMVRKAVERTLTSQGFVLYSVETSDDAVQAIERNPAIRLLLTDVVMPKENGLEVARKIAGISPDVKILFMSGYPNDVLKERGLELEEIELIQKPFTSEQLTSKVLNVLQTHGSHVA